MACDRSSTWRSVSNSMAAQRLPGVLARGAQTRAEETPSGERAGSPARPAGRPRLLRGRGLPLVLALEPLDAAGRVHELLLPREERMALGAHFHANLGPSRSSADDLAARTGNGRVHVVRMNTHLHGDSPPRSPTIPAPPQKRKNPSDFPYSDASRKRLDSWAGPRRRVGKSEGTERE